MSIDAVLNDLQIATLAPRGACATKHSLISDFGVNPFLLPRGESIYGVLYEMRITPSLPRA
jgi:hypothetical protein